MNWKKEVKENSKFLLANGFEIISIQDEGMGKIAKLSSQDFSVMYTYDKGPVDCNIETTHGKVNLIHLLNYLNNRQHVYQFPKFYWDRHDDCSDEYIAYFDTIIRDEFDKLLSFTKGSKNDYNEALRYSKNENLRGLNKLE